MKLYSFILLTIFSLHLFAQKNCLHLELSNINILYANVENPLKFNGVNDLNEYNVSSFRNVIELRIQNKNEIITIPKVSKNNLEGNIYIINNENDTVVKHHVLIKRIPDPVAWFINMKDGLVGKQELFIAQKLDINFNRFGFFEKATINWFKILIIKQNDKNNFECFESSKSQLETNNFFEAKRLKFN
jgi:hypothetical protein|tara:strand:+ start:3703 stop:4266 length:564 start_codon:yes stop_codon:yes gene_type:complete